MGYHSHRIYSQQLQPQSVNSQWSNRLNRCSQRSKRLKIQSTYRSQCGTDRNINNVGGVTHAPKWQSNIVANQKRRGLCSVLARKGLFQQHHWSRIGSSITSSTWIHPFHPGVWHNTIGMLVRWQASNVTQPRNNWRRGLQFTALERPSRSCREHLWCHATCLVPRLRTMTMPAANLGEITCWFSVRLKNQLNGLNRNGLRIQLLH